MFSALVLALTLTGIPPTHAVTGVVVDPDDLPVPQITVRIVCHDWTIEVQTAADGRFSADVPDDSCTATASVPGLEGSTVLPRGNSSSSVLRLAVKPVHEDVAVSAADALATLTLDRDAMVRVGPNTESVLRYALARVGIANQNVAVYVDGLPATVLPPLDMVESLRVNGSPFSAEYGDGDAIRLDIVPRAMSRKWSLRPNGSLLGFGGGDRLRPGATAMSRSADVGFAGPFPWARASFSGNVSRSTSARELAIVIPLLPESLVDEDPGDSEPIASTRTTGVNLALSYSAPAGSRAFVAGSRTASRATNVGAGGIVLPSAALGARTTTHALQASVSAVRARMISESGISLQTTSVSTTANSTDRGTSVEGLFVAGGAALTAQETARTSWTVRQVVRGSIRVPLSAGASMTEIRQRAAAVPNPAGTVIFPDLAAFDAARAGVSTGTRTVVAVSTRYGVVDRAVAGFVQATLVQAPTFEVNGGLRFDYQTRTPLAVSPRLSMTKRYGELMLEAGAGIFSRPIPSAVFLAERASAAGATPYVGVVSFSDGGVRSEPLPVHTRLAGDLHQARQVLIRASAERSVGRMNVGLEYSWARDAQRLGAVRATGDEGWVDVIASDHDARRHALVTRARYSWRRGQTLTASYAYVHSRDNGDGPFSYQPAGQDAEWAPTVGIAPHTVTVTASFMLPARLSLLAMATSQSGAPVDVSIGEDVNRDGLFIERGTARRNSGVVPGQQSSSLHLSRTMTVGRSSSWGGVRVALGAHLDNLLNVRNAVSVGTVLGTPTFGRALTAMPGRTVRFTVSLY